MSVTNTIPLFSSGDRRSVSGFSLIDKEILFSNWSRGFELVAMAQVYFKPFKFYISCEVS